MNDKGFHGYEKYSRTCQEMGKCIWREKYTQMETREVVLYEVSLKCYIWRLYVHPAKFDNFTDEKMSACKTVSVAQSKNSVCIWSNLSFKLIKIIQDSSIDASLYYTHR